MADKKSVARKTEIKVHDLVPRKDATGGIGALHSNSRPLSIPPPGFIMPNGNGNGNGNGKHH